MDDMVGPRNQVRSLRKAQKMVSQIDDEAADFLGLLHRVQDC